MYVLAMDTPLQSDSPSSNPDKRRTRNIAAKGRPLSCWYFFESVRNSSTRHFSIQRSSFQYLELWIHSKEKLIYVPVGDTVDLVPHSHALDSSPPHCTDPPSKFRIKKEVVFKKERTECSGILRDPIFEHGGAGDLCITMSAYVQRLKILKILSSSGIERASKNCLVRETYGEAQ